MPGQTRDAGGLLGASVETAEIEANAVTTAKIADGNVTLAKLADLATDKIMGRVSAGTGTPEAIAISDFVQSLLSDADAGTFRTSIGAGTGGGDMVGSNNLSEITVASSARTNLGLAALAVLATVGSDEIDADAVTYDKMQDTSATDVILGRSTVGAGTVEEIACTAAARSLLDDATVAAMRTTLEVIPGTDVQVYSALLTTLAGISVTDSTFYVGNGSTIVAETGATARTSLGLGSLAVMSTVNNGDWLGDDLAVENGGTGASTAGAARTNLGIDDIATLKSNLTATAAPTTGDDTGSGYAPGSIWVDLTNDKSYICLDATAATAVWTEITGGGGGGLSNVVEDTTPQLGGALDGQGNDITGIGVLTMTEQAAAEADVAGRGQLWIKTAVPNELWFTDDAGTDFQVATLAGTETLTNKTITLGGTLTADAQNIATDTTTGTKIGTGATQKIGFFNATPIVQPSHVADAQTSHTVSDGGETCSRAQLAGHLDNLGTAINNILDQLASLGLQADS